MLTSSIIISRICKNKFPISEFKHWICIIKLWQFLYFSRHVWLVSSLRSCVHWTDLYHLVGRATTHFEDKTRFVLFYVASCRNVLKCDRFGSSLRLHWRQVSTVETKCHYVRAVFSSVLLFIPPSCTQKKNQTRSHLRSIREHDSSAMNKSSRRHRFSYSGHC
jgi:hypothetical protein